MSQPTIPRRFSIPRPLRRLVIAAGIGGSAVVLWLEEIMLFADTILTMVFLGIVAGILNLFNYLVFKAQMPRRDD